MPDLPPDQPPVLSAATREGLTISPALDLVLEASQVPQESALIDRSVLRVIGLAVVIGLLAVLAARILLLLIGLFTNLSFYGRWSAAEVSPAHHQLGAWVIAIPIIGSLAVGIMARFGSKSIRGHGIPEAMEQVLTNRSRIPARMMFLKPLSAAVAVGTGGPFGAEGPIIATGAALGSVVGQLVRINASERKTLLAAGAAAGMSATFGSPVSAVLLAVELLLFEFRPRSLIPVAFASATAAGVRAVTHGMHPVFEMPNLAPPTAFALAVYVLIGAMVGIAAVGITRFVYSVEDHFERLPIHWMWWPMIGGLVIGLIGYVEPLTLGIGMENIERFLTNDFAFNAALFLTILKFLSWSISLGSGTSGGTLAPLFTIGGGTGFVAGWIVDRIFPFMRVDVRIAAMVGMAAMFAGATRALLASVVFAFETTLQPMGLLPLLGGCTAAYLTSCLLMQNTLLTEKIARRGVRTTTEYAPDTLDRVIVRDVASRPAVVLRAEDTVATVRAWLASGAEGSRHQGFPVVNQKQVLVGVLTRKDLMNEQLPLDKPIRDVIARTVKFVYEDISLQRAAEHMVNHGIGRLPVVQRHPPHQVIGMVTRSDLLSAYKHSIDERLPEDPSIQLWHRRPRTQVNR